MPFPVPLAPLRYDPAASPNDQAQGVDYVKANYTKSEYQIPMRDGVRLFTAVYVPKDTVAPCCPGIAVITSHVSH